MATNTSESDEKPEWYVRKATGRRDSESVRLSVPADVVDNLGVVAGDNVVIINDEENGTVQIASLQDLFPE